MTRHDKLKLTTLVLALGVISIAVPMTAAGRQDSAMDGAAQLTFDGSAAGQPSAAAGNTPVPAANLDLSKKYLPESTYIQHVERHRTGPAWERCQQGRTSAAPTDYTRRHYAFRDKTTQAYYWANTEGFYHDAGYYAENTEVEVVWWDNVFANTEWVLELRDTQKTATPVDSKGQPVSLDDALKPKDFNGQQVIDMQWKYQSSSVPKNNFCFVGEQTYVRRIVAADNKKELVHRVYLDAISDENLVQETTYEYGYGSGPFSTYEPVFTDAGWNKEEARKRGDESVKRVMDAGGPSVQGQEKNMR